MRSTQIHVTSMRCKNCGRGEFILDESTQELICISCGHIILTQNIEKGPEWRTFEGEEESKRRVGMPPTPMMPDRGVSTIIGIEDADSTGKRIVGRARRDFQRLRMWQRRISFSSSIERNLAKALSELNRLGEKLDISLHVLKTASHIYRMALENDLIRGRSVKSMSTAALYAAIRYEGVPITLKELSRASDLVKGDLGRDYRMLVKELRLRMPVVDPAKYVRKICARGGLGKKVMLEAEKIVRLAQERGIIAGKEPVGIAAAAVYYACVLLNLDKTNEDIADAADVTTVTVRNRYRGLEEELDLEDVISIKSLVKD
ncbi:MAG: transcription initiation factor IIB family protein [Candidatus Geothermarchaeales archaeon]